MRATGGVYVSRMDHTKPVAESPAKKKGVHWAIKAWLALHVLLIFSRSVPLPTEAEQQAVADGNGTGIGSTIKTLNLQVLRNRDYGAPYYTESLGFWQYWDMFAPNPAQEDIWLDAEVLFADGTTQIVPYPRMKTMGLFEKFLKERYRKYGERLNNPNYSWKWPHTAHWFAAQAWTDPNNPPVRVNIRRHFHRIEAPPAPLPTDHQTYVFYTASIDQHRMEAMKK